MSVKRAIDDGSPVRTRPWVTGFQGSEEFGGLEKDYVCRVLDKRRVFRFLGDMQDSEARKVEEAYCRLTGAKHALAVNSGTSALIAALSGVYVNWEYVLKKQAATPAGCPWTCGFYKGDVQYSREMCPKTLDYLGRAIHISLSQRLTRQDIAEAVTAIRKVAEMIR